MAAVFPKPGEEYRYDGPPEEPPPADWRWWNPVLSADPSRQPQVPTLIAIGVGEAEAFPDLDQLAQRLAGLLNGAAAELHASIVLFGDFDAFPAWAVRAAGGDGVTLATVAIQKTKPEALQAALATARGPTSPSQERTAA